MFNFITQGNHPDTNNFLHVSVSYEFALWRDIYFYFRLVFANWKYENKPHTDRMGLNQRKADPKRI